jgi:hypothetical protein
MESWTIAKRIDRFLCNVRMKTEMLYQIGQQVVEQEYPVYLVVGIDPVNLEKPYVEARRGERGTQSHASGIGW